MSEFEKVYGVKATERFNKLPRWAQEHINNLTRLLNREREDRAEFGKAMTGQQETNIVVNHYAMDKHRLVYLPDGSQVTFKMKDGSEFTIGFDESWKGERQQLRVSQDRSIRGTLAVAPSASNVVYIFSKER